MIEKNEQFYKSYLEYHRISRRKLLGAFVSSSHVSASSTIPTPPFSAREDIFIAICNGCGDCARVCPQGIINIVDQKATLDLIANTCDFCGQCAISCPTKALHIAFARDTKQRPTFLSSCLYTSGQVCDDCITSCPQKALSVVENQVTVSDACNGCGECKFACFAQAIDLKLNL